MEIARDTLRQSVARCERFLEIMRSHSPTLCIGVCDVFKDHHPPHVRLWNTYHFLLLSRCTTPTDTRQHTAFQLEVYNSDTRDAVIRKRAYYTHPFFCKHVETRERAFFETFTQQYHNLRQRLNACLETVCRTKHYRYVRLSRRVETWSLQECAMYQTAYNRVLQKNSPFDMHYASELMAISVVEALAQDSLLVAPQHTAQLVRRLYKQYSKRRRMAKHTAKACAIGFTNQRSLRAHRKGNGGMSAYW